MGARLGGFLLLLALCACRPLETVPPPNTGQSFIVVQGNGTRAQILASDGLAQPFAIGGEEPVRLFVYEQTLADLFLEPGPLQALDVRAAGARPLPATSAAFQLATDDPAAWRPLLLPDPELPGISVVPLERCAAGGGCFESQADREMGNCKRPCPASMVAAPIAPSRPAAPAFLPCPDGWLEGDEQGIPLCRPAARVSCPDGQFQTVAAAGCKPIGDPCPPSGFADWPADGRRRAYVDPAALPGGDGSEGQPFDNLEAALRAAGLGGVVLLSGGSIDWPGGEMEAAALVGACTSGSIVRLGGTMRVAGTSTIQDLSLVSGNAQPYMLAADPGSRLQLSRVMLGSDGQQPERALVANRALVRGRRLRVRAQSLAVYMEGSSLDLSEVALEAPGNGVLTAFAGLPSEVRLDQFWVRTSSNAFGVSNSSGYTQLTNGLIEDASVGVHAGVNTLLDRLQLERMELGVQLVVRGATLAASRVLIEDTGQGFSLLNEPGAVALNDVAVLDGRDPRRAPGPSLLINGGAVQVQRALIARVYDAAMTIETNVDLSDVHISQVLGADSRGIQVLGSSGHSLAEAKLERVWIEGAARGLRLRREDGDPFQAQVRDLTIDRDGGDGDDDHGLEVALGKLVGERIAIRGYRQSISVEPIVQNITLLDLDLSHFSLAGVVLIEPETFALGENKLILSRARISEGMGNAGLDVRASWSVMASNLEIAGLQGAGTSVSGILADTGRLALSNFSITNVTGVAFTARNDPALTVSDGRVRDCSIVLLGGSLAELMMRVQLDGNGLLGP